MESKDKFQLILGSQSPRREELLKWMYVPFQIMISDVEEKSDETEPDLLVQDLALQKARAVFARAANEYSNPFVIGADTIVVLGDRVLEKPIDRDDAKRMLLLLKNKSHKVMTGVAFVWGDQEYSFYEETEVHFDDISNNMLELYLDTNESLDKAGSYGIQGAALGFIGSIHGSYSNVVGLPVNVAMQKIKKILSLNDTKNWREKFEI